MTEPDWLFAPPPRRVRWAFARLVNGHLTDINRLRETVRADGHECQLPRCSHAV